MVDIQINKFNNDLIEQKQTINIIDYVKEVNNRYYQIDIKFIDEFIELIYKDEYCIHHNLLQKYGISKMKGGTADIKKILNQNKFEENKDYIIEKIKSSAINSGCTHKINYYLRPKTFEMCLMRSLKTRQYAKYYILLGECIKYYNNYQNKLNEVYIIELKNKIIKQNNNITELKNKIIKKNNNISLLKDKIDFYDSFWQNKNFK